MMGKNKNVPPGFGQNFPPPPWYMYHPQNFETFVKVHQFHQQQMAKSHASQKQSPTNNKPQGNKPQAPPSIFDHIDGFMNKANKYYPYMKKAGSFLNNFNKMF